MKQFIVIYHATPEALQQMAGMTDEQRNEGMKPWFAWKERLGDKLIDMGAPLFGGVQLNPDGTSQVSNKDVAGYSVIQANDMEEAKDLLKGHPHYGYGKGCNIEVHEVSPL